MKARHGLRFIFSHIDTLGFGGHIGERVNGMWHIDRELQIALNMWNAQVCNQFQKQIDLIETLHIILVISDVRVHILAIKSWNLIVEHKGLKNRTSA